MKHASEITKEVSCKSLTPLLRAAEEKNIDLNKLLKGIPYELHYLRNKYERIEWKVFCDFIKNMRSYFSSSDFHEIGAAQITKGLHPESILAAFILFTSNKISQIFTKHLIKIGNHMFSCVNIKIQHQIKNKVKVIVRLEQGKEMLPEFFILTYGSWEQMGKLVGHKDFKIVLNWIPQGAIYDISWEKEGVLYKFKRRVRWLFSIKKALLELNDSHHYLLKQYEQLENSEKLLQKHTNLLKTAYEICRSIRKSSEINTTLKIIADELIKEKKFSFVKIKLFEDMESNSVQFEAESGNEINLLPPIIRSIIINEKKIGELTLNPNVYIRSEDIDELFNYLMPVINISIHDSLVLRSVTSYKNNLETKVVERTTELSNAQDELKETILLLQAAQQSQNSFFTNISHEFRTPLTLIIGPMKQIIDKIKDEKIKDDLNVVHRNARNLLRLVNQLLDLSKIESGNMKLQASQINIIPFLKALVLSFSSFAERKRIALKFNSSGTEINVFIDKEKIEKIVTNILSNAFKFTPEAGIIEVVIQASPKSSPKERTSKDVISPPWRGTEGVGKNTKPGFVEISISDTGIGIPGEKLPRIFDRFYQVDGSHKREQEGTGIGLALTKELIELHKGTIEVESIEGKGTTFIINLPLGKKHLKPEEIIESLEVEEGDAVSAFDEIYPEESSGKSVINFETDADKLVLLIVEDNIDVRNYIKDNLMDEYKIIEAADGKDGLNKSLNQIPDLIISDVMMPNMDGFELCHKLKTDERTSHIPVIMLTAKAAVQDKIEGYETGADDYIMKPFDPIVLKVRIKNLIEQRKRIHEYFRKHGLVELDESKIAGVDKKFLQKVISIINENISNSAFSVELLAERMAVHRVVLRKKIVSLIGEPPVELIKRMRLTKSAELLEKNFGNITEVAYQIGFNNPAYFSECFKKQFGVSPSQYSQKITNH